MSERRVIKGVYTSDVVRVPIQSCRASRDSGVTKTLVCKFTGKNYSAERTSPDELVISMVDENFQGTVQDRNIQIRSVADLARVARLKYGATKDFDTVQRTTVATFVGAQFVAELTGDSELSIYQIGGDEAPSSVTVTDPTTTTGGGIQTVSDLARHAGRHYRNTKQGV